MHAGAMIGYGQANTDATALDNPNRAHGDADGYSYGIYATWYMNDWNKLGAYLDFWAQYGTFDNSVTATAEPLVTYDSDVTTVSLEGGYAFGFYDRWSIEPQGQVIYFDYSQDSLVDGTDTLINGGDEHGWMTRLGFRTDGMFTDSGMRHYQPYFEANWWHSSDDAAIAFNGIGFESGIPDNRYEVGLGLNAEVAPDFTVWVNGEYQWGSNWDGAQATAGLKFGW